jgi:LEA14-like dessication related protein
VRYSPRISRSLGLATALTLVLGLAACAHTSTKVAPVVEPEVLTFDVEFQEQGIAGAKLNFPWSVKNPTAKPIVVQSIRYKLAIEGEPDFIGSLEPKLPVPPQGSVSQPWVIEAPLATTEQALASREGKTALRFGMSATFTIQGNDGSQDYEGEWFGDIFPPQRPSIAVEPHAARFGNSSSKAELTFTLVVNNPNPFTLPTDGLDYTIDIADIRALEGTVAQNQKLAANAEQEFEIVKTVGDGADKSLAAALQGRALFPYRFEGTLRAGSFTLKKTVEGEIAFSR